jgi:hypothetical protein
MSTDRLVQFLDLLAGPGQGSSLLDRLRDPNAPDPPDALLSEVARSEAFARAYRHGRAHHSSAQTFKSADLEAVGLAEMAPDTPFERAFDEHFAPRLAGRAEGFSTIFSHLTKNVFDSILIVETGTLRLAGNWAGDGQSTFLFDYFVREHAGKLISIDIAVESVATARKICSAHTNLMLNDSIIALHTLSNLLTSRISLLYLDSFDLDAANPEPSATHHAMELAAAMPLLGPGSLVAVDDYAVQGAAGGKGAIVDLFMRTTDAEVLYSGYQKIWRLR